MQHQPNNRRRRRRKRASGPESIAEIIRRDGRLWREFHRRFDAADLAAIDKRPQKQQQLLFPEIHD